MKFICHTLLLLLFSIPVFATERMAPSLVEQAKISSSSAGAETLFSVHHSILDSRGHWSKTSYYSLKINDINAARDYGRISIPYNNYYSNAKLEFANVFSKDGELKPVSEDAIQVRSVNTTQDFYEDRNEIIFSLPQVEPGSIIEFQITKTTKVKAIDTVLTSSISPYWFQPLVAKDGFRADAVKNFSYQLTVPPTIEMHTKVYGNLPDKPKLEKTDSQYSHTWKWENVPELTIEASMPPSYEFIPSITSSTDTQWEKIDTWTWNKIEPKLVKTSAIDGVISSLNIAGNATDQDKIKAVFAYLQTNIRYVFAHLGRGGYEPHFPDEIINDKYGDCKDQTVLALALFKELGIDAYPLLVETLRQGKSDTSLVELIFDHMMVWIPATKTHEEIWMDTTGDYGLFPGASAYIQGQPAMIVNGKGGKLIQVNMDSQENLAHLDLNYTVNEDLNIIVDVEMLYKGAIEQNMRNWWQHDNNRDTTLKQTFTMIFEDKGQYKLSSEVLNAENIYEPFKIVGQFKFDALKNQDTPINLGVSVIQLIRVFGINSGLQIPKTRKNRYVTALPIKTKLTAKFEAPKNYRSALIQSAENFSRPYFEVQQKIESKGNIFFVEINTHQPPLNLSSVEYENYYNDMLKLGDTGAWVVNMQLDSDKLATNNITQLKNTEGENTLIYQVSLAKKHINSGDFQKALPVALRAVEIDNKNGEAWFVLGMAQGFSGSIEESQQAFENAKKLGFVP